MHTPALHRGFTLVETMAAVTILAVLGSIVSFILIPAFNAYSQAAAQAQIHTELTMAMDRIERELRAIGLNVAAAPDIAPNIASITPTSITWNSNWSVSLDDGEVLLVENGGSPRILLRDVMAFSIQPFDESNSLMSGTLMGSECDPVRRLLVSATIERDGVTHMLRTKVFIRSTVQGGGT